MTDQTKPDAEIIDVTSEETTPAVGTPSPQPQNGPQGSPMTLFGTTNPAAVIEAATATANALTDIIKEKELYKQIGDRNHVFVEGWTLLGSLLGVFPITISTTKVTGDDGIWAPPKTELQEKQLHSKWCKQSGEGHRQAAGCDTYTKEVMAVIDRGAGGWEARVEAHTLDGRVIGAAESECRWEEANWWDRDSHALRSMAQTRATAKALRMPLGFIVELAGFAATPAEEMDAVSSGLGRQSEDSGGSSGPDNNYKCPACGSGVYDNRDDNARREERGEKAWPAFKCKNPKCTGSDRGDQWVTWSTSYFLDAETKAKQAVYNTVKAHKAAWKVYWPEEDPDYSESEAELVRAAWADDDPKQMAGILWNFLAAGFDNLDEPTDLELRTIPAAAAAVLVAAGDDANDILTVAEAWERGEASVTAEDFPSEPAGGYA